MKKILSVLVILLLVVGCSSKVENPSVDFTGELLNKEQLIIGTSPDYPPFESLDTKGNIVGFDVDLMNAVVEEMNKQNNTKITIVWKPMDFSTIIGALQANQVDVGVSGFTYDPDRDVFFSKPYIYSQQVIVVNKDSNINVAEDLANKKVGAQSGTTGETAVKNLKTTTLVSLTDASQLFAQLKTNIIDAVVIDKAVAENYLKENEGKMLEKPLVNEDMSIIALKNKTNLQKAIDNALEAFMKTEAYEALLVKWELK